MKTDLVRSAGLACLFSLSLPTMANLCWVIKNNGKCGIELAATCNNECLRVICEVNRDCSLLAYDLSGKTACDDVTLCFCFAVYLTEYTGTQGCYCAAPAMPAPMPAGLGGQDVTAHFPARAVNCP